MNQQLLPLLFAGRSHQRVREEWMPKGGSLASTRLHGVFTWHLAQLLRQQGWQDDERLIEQVRQRFVAEQRLSPVPMLLGQRHRTKAWSAERLRCRPMAPAQLWYLSTSSVTSRGLPAHHPRG